MSKARINLALDSDLYDKVRAAAKARGLSGTALINEAVAQYLTRTESTEPVLIQLLELVTKQNRSIESLLQGIANQTGHKL